MDFSDLGGQPVSDQSVDFSDLGGVPVNDKSISGFAKNLGTDVVDTGKSLASTAKTLVDPGNLWESSMAGSLEPTKEKLSQDAEGLKNIPSALLNEGKRLGGDELLKGNFGEAANKFGNAFYNKPLTSALDFAPLFGGAESAAGKAADLGEAGEAAKTAAVVEEIHKEPMPDVARVAPNAQPPVNLPPEAADILKKTPQPTSTATAQGGLADKIKNALPSAVTDPLQEVNKYLQAQYGKVAGKPSFAETAARYLKEHAQNMSLKNMGASPLQVKQMGAEPARALGQMAMDRGITSPMVGTIGMREKVAQINQQSGNQIGSLRKIADSRGSPGTIEDIANQIKAKLDPIYTKGIESGQKGSYMKALQELQRAEPTHQGLAALATKLNASATAAKSLKQADSAISDVANEVSRINNNSVASHLSPQEQSAYDAALKDFGATKKIQQFLARKESREAAGRMGPGGGIRHMMQDFLDQFGYRAQSKIASKMADAIHKNPGIVKDLPSLFKEFIHQTEDLGEEIASQ